MSAVTCCAYPVVYFQNVDLCPPCYEKYGHEHAMRKYSADSDSHTATKSGASTSDVIQRCIETVAHAAACTQGTDCPRQPECKKMMDVLRHARACTLRTSCTVCQQLMALCVTHARACTTDSSVCHVPFCAELRRHIQRRQALQRHQQHQMDDRRRALMTGTVAGNEDFAQTVNSVEIDSDTVHQYSGKGGDSPQLLSSRDISSTESNPTNVTVDQEHLIANANVLHQHSNRPTFSDDDKTSTSAVAQLKVLRYPTSQTAAGLTSGVDESTFLEKQSVADEALQPTESSARHQLVVGCLRMLKKLNPSISKQNLLQLLCHCSRQQLTALQDKVISVHLYVRIMTALVILCPQRGFQSCDEPISLYVCEHISESHVQIFFKNFVHVNCSHGCVLLWHCDPL